MPPMIDNCGPLVESDDSESNGKVENAGSSLFLSLGKSSTGQKVHRLECTVQAATEAAGLPTYK